jgi:hypothetical protein
VLRADNEKDILALSHGLEHVPAYKVASARRLDDCDSALISKPILNASRPTPHTVHRGAPPRRRTQGAKVKVTLKLEQTRWQALRIQALREGRSARSLTN